MEKRSIGSIVNDLQRLVDELSEKTDMNLNKSFAPATVKSGAKLAKRSSKKIGALGAINILTQEGFFNHPKSMALVIEKLKEMGHYHSNNTVAMNLLNLTRKREFNRIMNKEIKQWEYVLRK